MFSQVEIHTKSYFFAPKTAQDASGAKRVDCDKNKTQKTFVTTRQPLIKGDTIRRFVDAACSQWSDLMDLASLTLRDLTAGFHDQTETSFGQNDTQSANHATTTLRRCRTREQGSALMTVSHAIEYLLDSRLSKQEETSQAEREALAILLSANLSVYREGAEIIPFATRLRQWFRGGSKNKVADATA
ncbi:hypothetical protein HDF16_001140 [Granulicella aggregans]|uniref:Uncharacterized protein n=2 Tax=Granulicella aggregans TaxID=474949 RepID=A0A7W7ZAS1_9BACT|nr:hypothetical protein [Granulicella aggregans]